MLDDIALAKAFKALAHPRRARIFRLLSDNPELGNSLTGIQRATGLKETPLVHHLREMERCGLLTRQRRGPYVAHVLTTGPLTRALDEVARLSNRAKTPARRAA